MLRTKSMSKQADGFTLIELMIVVLIIAVLLAIAVPTFLGARSASQDRAAQSSARNALTAAKVIQSNTGSYTEAGTAASMTAVEPALSYATGSTASTGPTNVNVSTTADAFGAAVLSDSGSCFRILDTVSAGTTYDTTTGSCVAATSGVSGGW